MELDEKDIAYAKLESLNAELGYSESRYKFPIVSKRLLLKIEIDLLKVQIKYIKKHYNL